MIAQVEALTFVRGEGNTSEGTLSPSDATAVTSRPTVRTCSAGDNSVTLPSMI